MVWVREEAPHDSEMLLGGGGGGGGGRRGAAGGQRAAGAEAGRERAWTLSGSRSRPLRQASRAAGRSPIERRAAAWREYPFAHVGCSRTHSLASLSARSNFSIAMYAAARFE